MAAVVKAIITSRKCSILVVVAAAAEVVVVIAVVLRFLSYKKIAIVMAVIIAKIRLRIFSECPKTSDHNSNATPFKESYNVLILSLRAALRLI